MPRIRATTPAARRVLGGLAGAIVAALTAALAGAGALAGEALPTAKVLPLELALQAAEAALDACRANGYRVSVAVVDRGGLVTVQLRGDGAGPHTLDSSARKAYTALSLRRSTRALVALVRKYPAAAGLARMNEHILLLGGGLPIEAGDEVIAAIGVGGAPGGGKDEACARAGLKSIVDRLH